MRPSPAIRRAASSSWTSKLLTPQDRILPPRRSCSKAAIVSSSGCAPAQCRRYESSRSVRSRASDRSQAAMVPFRRGMLGKDLRDQKDVVAPPVDRPGDDLLGVAVHLGGVDVRHPEIEAPAQRGDGGRAIAPVQVPGALADHRDIPCGRAEATPLHVCPPDGFSIAPGSAPRADSPRSWLSRPPVPAVARSPTSAALRRSGRSRGPAGARAAWECSGPRTALPSPGSRPR